MFKNLSIRMRVIGALAIILVSVVALGIFAINRLGAVNAAATDVSTNWLPSANALGSLSQDFELYRGRQAQALLTTGDQRADKVAKVDKTLKAMQKDYADYAPMIDAGEETTLAATVKSAMDQYIQMSSTLDDKINAGDTAGGTVYYFGDLQGPADALRNAIHADREFQLTHGRMAADSGIKLGKDASGLIIGALVLAGLVCAGIGFILITTVARPVQSMAQMMRVLAKGDTSVKIPGAGERSELGEMAEAVDVFRQGMIRNRELEAETVVTRERTEAERKQAMISLADQFESAVGGIVDMVSSAATEMQATASQLTASAQESASQASTVSAAAEEAGTNVTSVAGAAEELGASVGEIGRQVQISRERSREAAGEADATAAVVQQLSEAADRITGIVDMISSIAAQTNLLALNATIESARAGEAGKGFAVVASEVKALATQTGKATADINTQIGEIQSITRHTVTAIESITARIRAINESSTTISAAVEQQGAATHEIIQAVTQASAGTAEVTSNITGVARMAEETGAGASQVLSASSELAQQAARLRTQVNVFLNQVRAA
jgi:methyl-accepting chemotaxis protein